MALDTIERLEEGLEELRGEARAERLASLALLVRRNDLLRATALAEEACGTPTTGRCCGKTHGRANPWSSPPSPRKAATAWS